MRVYMVIFDSFFLIIHQGYNRSTCVKFSAEFLHVKAIFPPYGCKVDGIGLVRTHTLIPLTTQTNNNLLKII